MKALSLTALAATALLTLSGAAKAENGHAYNGSFCKAYLGSQASHFNYQYNGIRNVTSGGRYIQCPVVVDEIANTSGTTRQWMHYTGSGRIACTIHSLNGNGSSVQSRSTNRVGTGWFAMPRLTTDAYWGNYSMFCLLPKGGMLNTIWLGERN